MRPMKLLLAILFTVSVAAFAIAETKSNKDETAIKKTVESYVAAFNRGDAKAVAAHWTPDGVFITTTGQEIKGRDKLEAAFKAFLAENKAIKLEVTPLAIHMESPGKAIEEGLAVTALPDKKPELTRYVAAHVKKDGAWKVAVLREVVPLGASPHRDKLEPLAWLVGDWVDKDATGIVETRCAWSPNGNFLVRYYSVSVGGREALQGQQVIGWDPAAKQIRSWTFDSNGGFGEGTWSKQGDNWYVNSTVVLNTGEKASSINVLKPLDDKSFSWQSTSRELGGRLLPNTPKITVVRTTSDTTQETSPGK